MLATTTTVDAEGVVIIVDAEGGWLALSVEGCGQHGEGVLTTVIVVVDTGGGGWERQWWAVVKSGSTPVWGPVKSGRKQTRAEVRGLGRG